MDDSLLINNQNSDAFLLPKLRSLSLILVNLAAPEKTKGRTDLRLSSMGLRIGEVVDWGILEPISDWFSWASLNCPRENKIWASLMV